MHIFYKAHKIRSIKFYVVLRNCSKYLRKFMSDMKLRFSQLNKNKLILPRTIAPLATNA